MTFAHADAWPIYGSLLVTGGSGFQAFNELRSFGPFAKEVLNTQQNIIDDDTERVAEEGSHLAALQASLNPKGNGRGWQVAPQRTGS